MKRFAKDEREKGNSNRDRYYPATFSTQKTYCCHTISIFYLSQKEAQDTTFDKNL